MRKIKLKKSALFVSAVLASQVSIAQQTNDSDDQSASEEATLEVIQVTATKRVTNLQETPVAVFRQSVGAGLRH